MNFSFLEHSVLEKVDVLLLYLTEMHSPLWELDQLIFRLITVRLMAHHKFFPPHPESLPDVQKSISLIRFNSFFFKLLNPLQFIKFCNISYCRPTWRRKCLCRRTRRTRIELQLNCKKIAPRRKFPKGA